MSKQKLRIDTLHPYLVERIDQIRRSRDTFKGTDAIKQTSGTNGTNVKGFDEEYLPKLTGQSKGEYKNYKTRAVFYSVLGKTITALVGAISRKPAEFMNTDSI